MLLLLCCVFWITISGANYPSELLSSFLFKIQDFLEAFDINPFKAGDDKKFRKQLVDNIIKYAFDHMSLITAAVLIKKKFTTEELAKNYYASVDVFDSPWF